MNGSHFDYGPLLAELAADGRSEWAESLRRRISEELHPERNGHSSLWMNALHQMPACPDARVLGDRDAVTVAGTLTAEAVQTAQDALRVFHPWRKGPFNLFSISIDTEWRSCLKWDRLAPHVDFRGRRVLDVGCGNGYYGWRMLDAGARRVVGLDPFLLYVFQFELIRRYAGSQTPHHVLPLSDADLPAGLHWFDTTVSMGVLYHRTSPIDHLQTLWTTLVPGGHLILETLIIEGDDQQVLVPEGRYAKMRNVWFIPTLRLLIRWLERAGFHKVRTVDVTPTTTAEQRTTDWMRFESLPDFLDPQNPSRTVEGHPAPIRAMLIAERR